MAPSKVVEGEADFHCPTAGKSCKTWYKVLGELSGRRPLVLLHGGPGVPSQYMKPIEELNSRYGIPMVVYDQIGAGKSTHLPEKNGVGEFWTVQLFIDELNNLLRHLNIESYDVLGHSWGGMLATAFAGTRPKGLNKVIISNSPSSINLWVETANGYRKGLPQDVQDTLTKHEDAGTTDTDEYDAAVNVFLLQHCVRTGTFPEPFVNALEAVKHDPTVYHTMNGPSEFFVNGTLRDWSIVEHAKKINVQALLINGRYDAASDKAVAPLFDVIEKVKWANFAASSHSPFYEEKERYLEVVGGFLA